MSSRIGVLANDLLVVDADHGNLFGDLQPNLPTGVERLPRAIVRHGEQSARHGQTGEPMGERAMLQQPQVAAQTERRLREELFAAITGLREPLLEAGLAILGILNVAQAVEGVVLESLADEMIGREQADGPVVDDRFRDRRARQGARNVHDGQRQRRGAGGLLRRVERGQNAVSRPADEVEHGERQRLRRRDVGPVAILIGGVSQDALDEHLLVRAAGKRERNFFHACGLHGCF